MTEFEEWKANQHRLEVTADGPKLVKKDDNGSDGIEPDCEQQPAKPKKNGNGGVVLYWGRNKPNNR